MKRSLGATCLAALAGSVGLVAVTAAPSEAQTVTTAACGINANGDCAVDADGNLFVSNTTNMIVKVTPEGEASLVENVPCTSCNGMTFDAAGVNLYVADTYAGGNIYEIAPDGTSSVYASGLAQPLSLAFGPDGYLFTTGASSVYKIATDGSSEVINSSGISRPHGLGVDVDGNVYVASAHDGNIYKLTPNQVDGYDRTLYAHVDGLQQAWACGYMVHAGGALFITNGDNITHRISIPGGVVTDYAGSGAAGWADGTASESTFIAPNGIGANADGSKIYVAEYAEGRVRLIESDPAGVGPAGDSAPGFRLRIAPNPFGPRTLLNYALPSDGAIRLAVYDASGSLVRTIVDGHRVQGSHQEVWDGESDSARAVSSGVYFFRLETEEGTDVERVTLVR